jgi:N-acetylglucosaminyldiphosphoundecaprenol N-acetyl-beta-D-mannosaminyltransferase
MADNWEQFRPAILMGVGAAFDFHAGKVSRPSEWIRRLSIEWFSRLFQEPRRLWKRYLVTNSLFFYYLMKYAMRNKE